MKVFARRDPAPFWRFCPLLEFTPHFGDLQSAVTNLRDIKSGGSSVMYFSVRIYFTQQDFESLTGPDI